MNGYRTIMLNSDQVAQFRQDGFLIVRGLLDASRLEAMKQRAESIACGAQAHVPPARLQLEPGGAKGEQNANEGANSLRKMSHVAFVDDVFRTHAMTPEILDCVEALLGPDLKLYQDQLFMKPPRIGSRQPYHQDQPLGFHVDPADRMVTCWAAPRCSHDREWLPVDATRNTQTRLDRQTEVAGV